MRNVGNQQNPTGQRANLRPAPLTFGIEHGLAHVNLLVGTLVDIDFVPEQVRVHCDDFGHSDTLFRQVVCTSNSFNWEFSATVEANF